ncbi:AP-1 complex subunit gamma-1-like [Corticium candelabrum]|uniref:AP-1 complex subunit gamma-1-like n=1 Tax=Corticium candelabrum TaxID=121492 RepID=UPI002E271B5F|nr:AP-1 complex subunit gamma-1-like [Corticium candelabrum]
MPLLISNSGVGKGLVSMDSTSDLHVDGDFASYCLISLRLFLYTNCMFVLYAGKVLRQLRVLGHGDNETSDAMNDILAQDEQIGLSSYGFALINDNNLKSLTKEIVSFVSDADMEYKMYIAYLISFLQLRSERRHAPDQKWHVDTVLQVLTMTGAYVEEDRVPGLIQLFAGMTELHTYIVQQLYVALSGDISQQSLAQIGVWYIGEYGDLLLLGPTQGEEAIEVSESDVLNVLQAVLESPHSLPTSLNFAVTSVIKLSTRFTQTVERIQGLVAQYGTNLDVELQQQSVEYSQLFSAFNHMRSALLERMPLPDVKASATVNDTNGAGESLPTEDLLGDSETVAEQPVSSQAGNELLDILGGLSVSAPDTLLYGSQLIMQQQLRMRLRISYSLNGSPVTEQGGIGDFPPAVSQ